MPLTIPKPLIPILTKPKVPGWLFVAALIAQYAVMATDGASSPKCSMKVQEVHVSTYSKERSKVSEVKLKISTSCSEPQRLTRLDASINEVAKDGQDEVVANFRNVVAQPVGKDRTFVLIENLTVPCNGSGKALYFGQAMGHVVLEGGDVVEVSGSSANPRLTNCRISGE
jgi:hypothetical protein